MNIDTLYKGIQKFKISKNLLIFLIFLFVTSMLWVLRSLSEAYTAEFEVSTHFVGLPQSYGKTPQTPNSVTARITGSARELNRTKKVLKQGISFSQNQIIFLDNKQYIAEEHIRTAINKKLPQEVRLLELLSDTLFLNLEKTAVKKVPVEINLNIEYQTMFDSFDKAITTPDSIIISGAEQDIEAITKVRAQKVHLRNVSDTVRQTAEIITQDNIVYSHRTVRIVIPVERFTEKSVELEPQIKNLPDTVNFISFPKNARIIFRISLNDYQSVTASSFELIADYNDIVNERRAHYTPKLIYQNPRIKNVRVSPQSFEYIMEIKKAEQSGGE